MHRLAKRLRLTLDADASNFSGGKISHGAIVRLPHVRKTHGEENNNHNKNYHESAP
jgi:hypothetical protein